MLLAKKLARKAVLRILMKHFYCKFFFSVKRKIDGSGHVFIFGCYSDIDTASSATINVYSQNKGGGIFQNKNQKQEVCVGKEVIEIPLQPRSKTTERYVLNSDPKKSQSNDLQLLVVYGTFVSHRTQNILNDTVLYEDFITIYVHAGMAPVSFWSCTLLKMLSILLHRDGIDFGEFYVGFSFYYMISNIRR